MLAADDQGRILLQKRRDTGQWAIPMGKQEIGETVAQCAVRETLEETGVKTEVTGLLGIYSDPAHIVAYSDGEVRQEHEIILTGRPICGVPAPNDEASDAAWFAPAELDRLDVHPTQRRQLADWIAGTYPRIDWPGNRRRTRPSLGEACLAGLPSPCPDGKDGSVATEANMHELARGFSQARAEHG